MLNSEIRTIEGNLLDFPPYCKTDPNSYTGMNNIAHSCNTRNIMGGGIAKQIKNRYPQAYEADTKAYEQEYDQDGNFVHWLGKYSKVEIESKFLPNNKGRIYNLYTQGTLGVGERQVNYEKFWRALKNMQEDLLFVQHETGDKQVLGLPYGISCGLAGGNWGIIKAMIEDVFLDSLIECYIVKFNEV
jgi:O-acetyl-ADP-ribose deacetylase (regulator of RNase III)